MDAHATIRSRSNPLLRRVSAVRAGREPGTLLLEGERLVADALRAGHVPEVLLVEESRRERGAELARGGVRVQLVEDGLLQKVSALKTSPGVLALCPAPAPRALDELALTVDALVLVVAGVADPGNLGAIARAAAQSDQRARSSACASARSRPRRAAARTHAVSTGRGASRCGPRGRRASCLPSPRAASR